MLVHRTKKLLVRPTSVRSAESYFHKQSRPLSGRAAGSRSVLFAKALKSKGYIATAIWFIPSHADFCILALLYIPLFNKFESLFSVDQEKMAVQRLLKSQTRS